MIKTINIIRWILSLLLAYGVYTETGVFTLIVVILNFIGIEMIIFLLKGLIKAIKDF